MLEFEEYKSKLNAAKPTLEVLRGALKLEAAQKEIEELEAASERPDFWNDVENSQKVQKRLKTLKNKCENYQKLCSAWDDMYTMCEMAIEENDDSMLEELESEYKNFSEKAESMRLGTLLTGEYDANNALLTLHPGAGGTEAQDWASMLYRMYVRWAERHGYKYTIMDYQDGDEAGIKSATIKIEGDNAYGFLKSEHGVHRLVRISPFDASGRRQTSFAAVEIMPEITDNKEIELRDEDISQVERSHFQNLENCKEMLRSKLAEIKEREHLEKISDIKGVQMKIDFGSAIRSYVFMPYQLVKDQRTEYENGNIQNVMDGDLDGFINAYLSMKAAD